VVISLWQAACSDPPVLKFNVDLEWQLWKLHEELREHTWEPGPYRTFYIHEPKKRVNADREVQRRADPKVQRSGSWEPTLGDADKGVFTLFSTLEPCTRM
jgi:hypothetical protein